MLLRGYYKEAISTVAPIALIAVSLNNAAIRKQAPFRFCWLDTPFQKAPATLFIALNAQSSCERIYWTEAPPAHRIQLCSVWQTTIQTNAEAIAVPCHSTESPRSDGMKGLVWGQRAISSTGSKESMLNFSRIQGTGFRDQFGDDSDDLLEFLVDHFHHDASKNLGGVEQHRLEGASQASSSE
ncbi:hypothetical protein COCSADRAFT_22138 [Bipolaris sorokiniana ND90Pr]|uniref:Uncharacterized protein n=1 Tax=Cochliobolus sativus (strain ND90Pr / ATCC 201652) TaxID=665912 RepID=M2TLG4_COCSN|nr:uncharacterized protein COCSADRAFT_22138 [Bipolaris sorokiniana ND90Pr]EMD69981.1 hypothetical protein COCSADRAFT_22138 [Bipolaris sorokiniana ND90Pr]